MDVWTARLSDDYMGRTNGSHDLCMTDNHDIRNVAQRQAGREHGTDQNHCYKDEQSVRVGSWSDGGCPTSDVFAVWPSDRPQGGCHTTVYDTDGQPVVITQHLLCVHTNRMKVANQS